MAIIFPNTVENYLRIGDGGDSSKMETVTYSFNGIATFETRDILYFGAMAIGFLGIMVVDLLKHRNVITAEKRIIAKLVISLLMLVVMVGSQFIRVNGYKEGSFKSDIFEEQLHKLNEIGVSIARLKSFVELQKDQLKESETLIKSLREEHNSLKPIVDVERQKLIQLFEVQSKFANRNLWSERIISFLLGVVASIVASLIINLLGLVKKSNNT